MSVADLGIFGVRARRARVLAERWPHAAPLLGFLVPVFEAQVRIAAGEVAGWPELLAHVCRSGPPLLAERAARWRATERADPPDEGPDAFFHLVLRQCGAIDLPSASAADCPRCGGPTVASVLEHDPQHRALRRELVCGWCGAGRPFPRVGCPACGEDRADRLPRLVPSDPPHVSIEGCACGVYRKAIDRSLDPLADPVVDDLATLPLDLVARERGWRRLGSNLAGV